MILGIVSGGIVVSKLLRTASDALRRRVALQRERISVDTQLCNTGEIEYPIQNGMFCYECRLKWNGVHLN